LLLIIGGFIGFWLDVIGGFRCIGLGICWRVGSVDLWCWIN